MKNLSDEELVLNYCISCMEFDSDTDVPPEGVKKNMLLHKELLSRLERGVKAIEAMEKIIASRETFLKSQMSVIGETDIPAEIFIEEVHSIIETFQIIPMDTKPLTIQIPKPDEDGCCNSECTMYNGEYDCCALDYNLEPEKWCKPGPGCPWFSEGGKDE